MTRIPKSEGHRETKRSLEEIKKQNVGPVYTSKRGFSEVLDCILRKQTSKESSLVFAILCIARDWGRQSGILVGLPKDRKGTTQRDVCKKPMLEWSCL